MDIGYVNGLDYVAFMGTFRNVVEGCPLIAAVAWGKRPFRDLDSLHAAFCDVVDGLSIEGKVWRA